MATRYADPPPAFIPPTKPNVRIAYVAGPALAATNAAVAKLPEATHTLDELQLSATDKSALEAAVGDLISTAQSVLSRDFAGRFFEWVQAAAYFSMSCSVDEEAYARCNASHAAKEALEREPALNAHDRAVKAYVELLEVHDAPPCGPLDHDRDYVPRTSGLLHDAVSASPIPSLIDHAAGIAWRSAPQGTGAWSRAAALIVMDAANEARLQARLRKPVSQTARWNTLLGSHDRLYDRFQELDLDDPQSPVMLERWCAAQDKLLEETQAPDMAALVKKLELAFARYSEFHMPVEVRTAIIADAQRLAAQLEPVT